MTSTLQANVTHISNYSRVLIGGGPLVKHPSANTDVGDNWKGSPRAQSGQTVLGPGSGKHKTLRDPFYGFLHVNGDNKSPPS